MADLTQALRWQSGFVRRLAQSVLERARAIRSSLPPQPQKTTAAKTPKKKATRKRSAQAAPKRSAKAKKVSGV